MSNTNFRFFLLLTSNPTESGQSQHKSGPLIKKNLKYSTIIWQIFVIVVLSWLKDTRRMKKVVWILNFLARYKYIIAVCIGVIIIGNALIKYFSYNNRINTLEKDIAKYTQIHKRDSTLLRKLETDPQAVRQVAREKYFMHTSDEDVFVLSDDEEE